MGLYPFLKQHPYFTNSPLFVKKIWMSFFGGNFKSSPVLQLPPPPLFFSKGRGSNYRSKLINLFHNFFILILRGILQQIFWYSVNNTFSDERFNPFHAIVLFLNPLKYQKTSCFLMISGDIEGIQWKEMGY